MDMTRLVFLDLETTGLDSKTHEILEIGILAPSNMMPPTISMSLPIEGWSAFVRRTQPTHLETASPVALQINRYSTHEWKDAINLEKALTLARPLLEDVIIVGHNVWMDCEFLKKGYESIGYSPPNWKYRLDTTTLIWEHLVPLGHSSLSLEKACDVAGIDNTGAHRALPDILRTKALFDALVKATDADRDRWWARIQATVYP